MDRVMKVFLGLVVALLLLVGAAFLIPSGRQPVAQPHPELTTMLVSAGGLGDRPTTLVLAYGFALLVVGIMSTAILVGMVKSDRLSRVGRWFLVLFVGYLAIFTGLTYTYAGYTRGESDAFFLGFPVTTAWMIYGVWLWPVLFALLYMYVFKSWYLTPEDEERFQVILAAAKARAGEKS